MRSSLLSGVGALLGSALAPSIREALPEERMLMLALSVCVVGSLTAAWVGDLAGSMLLAAIVAIVSTSGRLAFDSLVQRDAPDANRGRSFASFELRFQLVWVVGALIPVLVRIPLTVGFLAIAGVAGFALFSYAAGQRATNREPRRPANRRSDRGHRPHHDRPHRDPAAPRRHPPPGLTTRYAATTIHDAALDLGRGDSQARRQLSATSSRMPRP